MTVIDAPQTNHANQLVAVDAREVALRSARAGGLAPISMRLPIEQVLAVCGQPGSGRSALLLTLTGRARTRDGDLKVLGRSLPQAASKIRLMTSIARIGESGGPDPAMSVEEAVRDRSVIDGISRERGLGIVRDCLNLLGLPLYRAAMVGSLPALHRTWFAVALATIRPAQLVVLDDLDEGLNLEEQHLIWGGLRLLARTGPAIVASTAQHRAILADITIDLGTINYSAIGRAFPRQKQGENEGKMTANGVDPEITGELSEERIPSLR